MRTFTELKALIDQRGTHAVFGDAGEGWGIEQNAAELAEFLVVCQKLGVTSVLEVGTGYKAGLARFLHDDMGYRVTSVDITNYGHAYAGIRFLTWEQVQDLDEAAGFYGLGAHDLILIDGDHTYDAVAHDHAYYAQFTPKVIAFHDIAGLRECEGVRDYWVKVAYGNELLDDFDDRKRGDVDYALNTGYHEIIVDGEQRGGIGYIVLAEVEAPAPKPPAKPKPTPRKRKPAKKKATVVKK